MDTKIVYLNNRIRYCSENKLQFCFLTIWVTLRNKIMNKFQETKKFISYTKTFKKLNNILFRDSKNVAKPFLNVREC